MFVIDGLQYCVWDREYFKALHKNKITAVHITLVYHENTIETLRQFAKWNDFFDENSDLIVQVFSAEDILKAKEHNKVGIFFGAQNCSPIEDDVSLIGVMRRLGLLIMQLTYNNQSLLACGCYEAIDSGITRFGKEAIKQMNKVGMIIDMSHSGDISTLQAIEYSQKPICISHANPTFAKKALRNKSKDILKALSDSGGILGFSLYPFHLPNGSDCSLDNFCKMVADTADIIGVDCIGIGSDLCLGQNQEVLNWMRNGRWTKTKDYGEGSASNSNWPKNTCFFQDLSGMNNIYNGLIKYGFKKEETTKIIGKNWLDFLKKTL